MYIIQYHEKEEEDDEENKKKKIKFINSINKQNFKFKNKTFFKVFNFKQKIYFLQIFLLFIINKMINFFFLNKKIFKQTTKYLLKNQLKFWIILLKQQQPKEQLKLIFNLKTQKLTKNVKQNLVVILINIKNYLLLLKYLKQLLQLAFVVQYINATIINNNNNNNNKNHKNLNIIYNLKNNPCNCNTGFSKSFLNSYLFYKNFFNNFANSFIINIVLKKTLLLDFKENFILSFMQNLFNFFFISKLLEIFLGIQQKFKIKFIKKFLKASTELLKKSAAAKNLMALNKLSSRIFLE